MAKLSPFDIVSAVCEKSQGRLDTGECGYEAYVVNRALSNVQDTVFFANEMNAAFNLPRQMQFDFYFFGLDKRKRYGKWHKNQDDTATLDIIQEYLGCSKSKAKEVVDILKPHIEEIKQELDKGGVNGKSRRVQHGQLSGGSTS